MIKLGFVLLIAVILVQGMLFWKYQRQVKDICRQLSFLMKHDSNMLITREMDFGGIGELADVLNEWLELKRREKKEYLKKEEMISDTYTNLSHDIRTPLTSLDGYFQLMETCEDQEEQRRYMKIIQERIGSLKEMLEELFTFTKLKNDSFHLEMSSCCINKILKDTIFSYYDEWTGRGIEPEIQITDKLLFMNGNEQGIQRIFQNIIKNGLDHGEKKISISLEEVENNIRIQIKNQVCHVEKINVDQVFERFYKADDMNTMIVLYGVINHLIQKAGVENFQILKYTVTGKIALLSMSPTNKECLTAVVIAAAFGIVVTLLTAWVFRKRDI